MSKHNLNKVLILCGSTRIPSYTYSLCKATHESLSSFGFDPMIFDNRYTKLPLACQDGQPGADKSTIQFVNDFYNTAKCASAFIFASPVYHSGPSSILKNMLDSLDVSIFEKKPVGLISHGGVRSTQALDQMRIWARSLGSIAMTSQLCTTSEDYAESEGSSDPTLVDDKILCRLESLSNELEMMTEVMNKKRNAALPTELARIGSR